MKSNPTTIRVITGKSDLPRFLAILMMLAILLSAVFIYSNDIAHTPPGLASDAIWNLADALRISRGIPFHMAFGHYAALAGRGDASEPLHGFLLGIWFKLLGPYVFTADLMQIFLNLLSISLTYRAGLAILTGRPWRRWGALIAAGTITANMPMLFLSRSTYRPVLVPPVELITLILLVSACRQPTRARYWALGGFFAALGLHTYQAGIVIPVWAIGLALHQILFAKYARGLALRNAAVMLTGMMPPVFIWIALIKAIPGLFFRVEQLGSGPSLAQRALPNLLSSLETYFVRGNPFWTFNLNLPYAPTLNPVLSALCFVGIAMAVYSWKRADGASLLGGLILFSMPGALSSDPQNMLRLVGAVPVLALLVGWGAAWITEVLNRLSAHLSRQPVKVVTLGLLLAIIPLSIAHSDVNYQSLFADPAYYQDPRNWMSVPHNYTTAFIDAMKVLSKVDQPTYVPLWLLDNPAAAFFLQREAFPHVTTWARYGLKELPPGQFFFPVYWYYHMPALDDGYHLRVLLLPQDKTMVILPPLGLPPEISASPPAEGESGVSEIHNDRGWVIARTRPVARAELEASATPPVSEDAPAVGNGLRLLTPQQRIEIQPGQPTHILLEWQVTAPQPADLASVAQLIRIDLSAVSGGSDHWIMPYLYPSAYWQPGDIVPDWHEIQVPADLKDGVYRWGAGVYVVPNAQRLTVVPSVASSGPQLNDLWLWNTVRRPVPQIGLPLPPDAVQVSATVNHQIALEGYQLVRSTGQWEIRLYWRASKRSLDDYTIFVHGSQDDRLIVQHDQKPPLPTWAWEPGELVETVYTLALPANQPEPDTLYVGMYTYPALERADIVQDGQPRPAKRIVLYSTSHP